MAGRRDIDRTYKCVSEWRFFLVKSCICPFILSCFWQPYECVTGLSKVFWVVVSRYVCYSVCFSIFGKNSKVKFLIFFSWVVSFVVGSLWVVLRSSSVVWRSLWIVVGRCGSFRVLVTTEFLLCYSLMYMLMYYLPWRIIFLLFWISIWGRTWISTSNNNYGIATTCGFLLCYK